MKIDNEAYLSIMYFLELMELDDRLDQEVITEYIDRFIADHDIDGLLVRGEENG